MTSTSRPASGRGSTTTSGSDVRYRLVWVKDESNWEPAFTSVDSENDTKWQTGWLKSGSAAKCVGLFTGENLVVSCVADFVHQFEHVAFRLRESAMPSDSLRVLHVLCQLVSGDGAIPETADSKTITAELIAKMKTVQKPFSVPQSEYNKIMNAIANGQTRGQKPPISSDSETSSVDSRPSTSTTTKEASISKQSEKQQRNNTIRPKMNQTKSITKQQQQQERPSVVNHAKRDQITHRSAELRIAAGSSKTADKRQKARTVGTGNQISTDFIGGGERQETTSTTTTATIKPVTMSQPVLPPPVRQSLRGFKCRQLVWRIHHSRCTPAIVLDILPDDNGEDVVIGYDKWEKVTHEYRFAEVALVRDNDLADFAKQFCDCYKASDVDDELGGRYEKLVINSIKLVASANGVSLPSHHLIHWARTHIDRYSPFFVEQRVHSEIIARKQHAIQKLRARFEKPLSPNARSPKLELQQSSSKQRSASTSQAPFFTKSEAKTTKATKNLKKTLSSLGHSLAPADVKKRKLDTKSTSSAADRSPERIELTSVRTTPLDPAVKSKLETLRAPLERGWIRTVFNWRIGDSSSQNVIYRPPAGVVFVTDNGVIEEELKNYQQIEKCLRQNNSHQSCVGLSSDANFSFNVMLEIGHSNEKIITEPLF